MKFAIFLSIALIATVMQLIRPVAGLTGSEIATECNNAYGCRGICGNSFKSCGLNGICYCSNATNDYNGVTVAAFSDKTKCVLATPGSSADVKCKGRTTILSKTLNSYLCKVENTYRAFCDYRIKTDINERCTSEGKTCGLNGNCVGRNFCISRESGIPILPNSCKCQNGGFSKNAKCVDDTFCFNVCKTNPLTSCPGKACQTTSGKMTCFCAK